MSNLKAVIFGSIGTIAETSDIQRQSFNRAFAAAGIDWHWDPQTYRTLLEINGGQSRLRAYRSREGSASTVTDDQIIALHAAKEAQFSAMMVADTVPPRPGVVNLMALCAAENLPVALCTSTSRANVDAIVHAVGAQLPFAQFACIVSLDNISNVKPAPDAYIYCLAQLGINANEAVAIEDTPVSITAAKAAGLAVLATPGATTRDQNFFAADLVVPDLLQISLGDLRALLTRT
jgi:HAD superfamily hydrolase (TIGR01509 family)